MTEEYKTAYELRIVNKDGKASYDDSNVMPAWLLATQLGQFRQSLVEASKQFGQDMILELKVRDSPHNKDISKKTE